MSFFWPVKFFGPKFLQVILNIYTKWQQKMLLGFLKRFDCHSQHALLCTSQHCIILLFTVLLTAHHLLYQLCLLYILDLPPKLLSLQTILACFCLACKSWYGSTLQLLLKINQKAGEKTPSIKVSINFYQLWLISLDTPDSNNIMHQKKHKENIIPFCFGLLNFWITIFSDSLNVWN